ncbi:hypothetical protein R1flu_000735 [Riccia fluitans]|uniref:Uncharacterized protein n=1 Tax=Riccia fluitans TaxID=41844 RepID=A0ABD1Y1B8_9MARC
MGVETEGDFRSLLEQKEKELVNVCERQIELFHQQLLERDRRNAELSAKFSQLKDDFKYNLELLDERDAELTRYESEMAALHMSVKSAIAQQLETQKRLSETELQRLEEKRNTEEKEKSYQETLLSLNQQIESLQLTREELLSIHKGALEVEVERSRAYLENQSKALETQYQDKLRIHELQSKLALDDMENKLSQAEKQIQLLEFELDSKRAELREDADTQERKLRAEIQEKDGINKRLKKDFDELQTEYDELRSKATSAEFKAEQVSHKLQLVEAEHRMQSLQRRLQIDGLEKRLDMAESRVNEWESKGPGEISIYLTKIAQLEQVIATNENRMKLKLEGLETSVRDRLQYEDQKTHEFRNQAIFWKNQHDQLFIQYRVLQNGGNGTRLRLDFTSDKVHADNVMSNQNVSASHAHLPSGSDLLTSNSVPLGGRGKCIGGSSHSLGSSLPRASPLLSPVFSSPEDSLQNFLGEENTGGDERNDRVASLEEENRCLRGSVQNLKEQNERIRTVVGTMREEMETLQKTTFEKTSRPKTVGLGPQNGDIEEMRKIRDEVNTLMGQMANMTSELQQVQQMKQSLPTQPLQHTRKLEEPASSQDINSSNVSCDCKEAAARIADLERVQHVLRTQLERAAHDLMRIANERDLLMEISNSLHADKNRSHQQENMRCSEPSTQDHNHLESGKRASTSPEGKFHERRRTGATTSLRCSRASPPNTTSRSSLRPGGQESSTEKHVWINKNGIVRVFRRDQEQHEDSKHADAHDAEQENEKRRLLLEGTMTPLQERPELQQDFVHKGTPSQRSKLRASVKRREAQLAGRVKVRNYNKKDDELP